MVELETHGSCVWLAGWFCYAGIAVEKQHLIWKSVELEDKVKIADYKLTTGTTLQLVTAMRGGPLNIRRGTVYNVPVSSHSTVKFSGVESQLVGPEAAQLTCSP